MTKTGNRAVAPDPHSELIIQLRSKRKEPTKSRPSVKWGQVPEDDPEHYWSAIQHEAAHNY